MILTLLSSTVVLILTNLYMIAAKHGCLPSGPTVAHAPLRYSTCKLDIGSNKYTGQPVVVKPTIETLKEHEYPYEEHKIKTKDGYVLTVYRITGSPNLNQDKNSTKLPVYMNHGLLSNSDWWFIQPRRRNLPFILADAGYDVWISNCRGSIHSLEHEYLNHDVDLDYWNFSFHELAMFDVPAVISTILSTTGHSKLHYIGFSMGTTQLFIALSELPELNKKIQAGYLLAPIAYMGHCTNPLRLIHRSMLTEADSDLISRAGQGRVKGYSDLHSLLNLTKTDGCSETALKCGVCDNAYFAMFGYNAVQMNGSRQIVTKLVDSASIKTMSHYAQLIGSCKFQKYNYYPERNRHIYKSIHPPEYNLKRISSPLHFYYGNMDNFGVPQDVHITAKHLRRGVLQKAQKVNDYYFNHLDFCIAKDGDILVYNHVLEDVEKFDKLK